MMRLEEGIVEVSIRTVAFGDKALIRESSWRASWRALWCSLWREVEERAVEERREV